MINISIIIPVFNSDKTLGKCISSILISDRDDFEVVCVNDGSTDTSRSICDTFALEDKRVKVYHRDNSGVSAARNFGMKVSQGETFMFVDSDDFLDPSFLNSNVLNRTFFDLIIFGLNEEYTYGKWNQHRYVETTFTEKDFLRFYESHLLGFAFWGPWAKVFKRSVIVEKNIQFDESMSLGEDTLFLLNYLKHIKNIHVSDNVAYNYCFVEKSLSKEQRLDWDELFLKKSFFEVDLLKVKYGNGLVFNQFLLLKYLNYLKLKLKHIYLLNEYSVAEKLLILKSEKDLLFKIPVGLFDLLRTKMSLMKKIVVIFFRFAPSVSMLNILFVMVGSFLKRTRRL